MQEKLEIRPAISEHSFDYDNCVGNFRGEQIEPGDLIEEDVAFWAQVEKRIQRETKGLPTSARWVSSFSARQSQPCDEHNKKVNQSTSSFPFYIEAASFLDAECDTFLLADARGDLKAGTSFERAMDPNYQGIHVDWYFDESKITILYARMHRAAARNPNADVLFTAYDDRKDILDTVHQFFSEYPQLLPPNLKLNLCQHERGTDQLKEYPPIIANGRSRGIDDAYQKTVQLVGACMESPEAGKILRIPKILELKPGELFGRFGAPKLASSAKREGEEASRLGNMIFHPVEDGAAKKLCNRSGTDATLPF